MQYFCVNSFIYTFEPVEFQPFNQQEAKLNCAYNIFVDFFLLCVKVCDRSCYTKT